MHCSLSFTHQAEEMSCPALADVRFPVTKKQVVDAFQHILDNPSGCEVSMKMFVQLLIHVLELQQRSIDDVNVRENTEDVDDVKSQDGHVAQPFLRPPTLVEVPPLHQEDRQVQVVMGGFHGQPVPLAYAFLQAWKHHGCDASVTDEMLNTDMRMTPPIHFVFLGDYVDGGHKSVTTLALVLLLVSANLATALTGRHEALYPVTDLVTGIFGRFDEELRLKCRKDLYMQCGSADDGDNNDEPAHCELSEAERTIREMAAFDEIDQLVRSVFRGLPVAAVVAEKYFCICGGLTPKLQTLADFKRCGDEVIAQSVLSDPMDDDDEYQDHELVFATNMEKMEGFIYSFDAACHFLHDAGLLSIIRCNSFVLNRDTPGTNSCGRPWHYQYSPFDSGYRLFRKMPTHGTPSTITIFSCPSYCGVNQNLGTYVVIEPSSGKSRGVPLLNIRQFAGPKNLEGQPPGALPNAFSWAQPLLVAWLLSALQHITADDAEPVGEPGAALTEEEAKVIRFRRLCTLLKSKGQLDALPGAADVLRDFRSSVAARKAAIANEL